MNDSALFAGAVVFVVGNVDPKVSTGRSPIYSLSLESSKFNEVHDGYL